MQKKVIEINNLGKQYRLGQVGTGSIADDFKRFWYSVRGKENPFLKIGDENDRSKKSDSDYVWALKNINFSVNQGDILGIIGKNGAGKSTLLKILSRTTSPTTGEYKIKGRVASLLEVGTGFHPDLSGRENVFLNGAILGMSKAEIKRNLDEIIAFVAQRRFGIFLMRGHFLGEVCDGCAHGIGGDFFRVRHRPLRRLVGPRHLFLRPCSACYRRGQNHSNSDSRPGSPREMLCTIYLHEQLPARWTKQRIHRVT